MAILQQGSRGDEVKALQSQLTQLGFPLEADGAFGPATLSAVQDVQSIFGYDVDGKVGPATSKLIEAQVGYGWSLASGDAVKRGLESQGKTTDKGSLAGADLRRTLKQGTEGPDVRYLQHRLVALGLKVDVDGKFGPGTLQAVRALQESFGYTVDGLVGPVLTR